MSVSQLDKNKEEKVLSNKQQSLLGLVKRLYGNNTSIC